MKKLRRLLNGGEGSFIRPFVIFGVVVVTVVYILGFSGILDKTEHPISDEGNIDQVEIQNPTPSQDQNYFTLGSTKDEVIAVQGKPSSIVKESWFYGGSKVDFQGDTVVSYNNRQRILHVRLEPKFPTNKKYFSVGLTKDEVVAVQGTPTNIVGSYWYYGSSKVEFKNGVVVAFNDSKRVLKVKSSDQ